jgi:hypothetical protein
VNEPTRLVTRLRAPWPEDTRVHALSIEWVDGAWYMFLLTSSGDFINDTWHRSLEEAFEQGQILYGVTREDWRPVPEGVEVSAFMKN